MYSRGKVTRSRISSSTRPARAESHPALAGRERAGRQVSEIAVDQLQGLVGLEVSGDGQAGVGGGVVALEEVFDVIQDSGVQVLLGANGHPVIRVGHREQHLLDVRLGHTVGAIFVGLAPLVFDHVPLHFKTLLVQGVQQEAHAVGLQPQGKLKVIGRDVLPVVGAVGSGGAVEIGPGLLQGLEEALVVVLGAFEHDVLEEMGEPGAALLFVLGANVVPHVDRGHRDRRVPVQNHVQTVGQRVLLKVDGHHQLVHLKPGSQWSA